MLSNMSLLEYIAHTCICSVLITLTSCVVITSPVSRIQVATSVRSVYNTVTSPTSAQGRENTCRGHLGLNSSRRRNRHHQFRQRGTVVNSHRTVSAIACSKLFLLEIFTNAVNECENVCFDCCRSKITETVKKSTRKYAMLLVLCVVFRAGNRL